MPLGAIGPSKLDTLISKIIQKGPNPLISTYYDLSYGKMPQGYDDFSIYKHKSSNALHVVFVFHLLVMLVVDGSMETTPVLQNPVRWTGPKAAPFYIKDDYPVIIHELLDHFLPKGMNNDHKRLEKTSIIRFIKELNAVRIIKSLVARQIKSATLSKAHNFFRFFFLDSQRSCKTRFL